MNTVTQFHEESVDISFRLTLRLLLLSQVMCRLLSLPEAYWRSVLATETEQVSSSTTAAYGQDGGHGGFHLL